MHPEQSMKRKNEEDAKLDIRMRALVLISYNAAPHNRYQPHPAKPEPHTKCSNRAFVLLKMGIMMPETC